jgi:hypothetical protein
MHAFMRIARQRGCNLEGECGCHFICLHNATRGYDSHHVTICTQSASGMVCGRKSNDPTKIIPHKPARNSAILPIKSKFHALTQTNLKRSRFFTHKYTCKCIFDQKARAKRAERINSSSTDEIICYNRIEIFCPM